LRTSGAPPENRCSSAKLQFLAAHSQAKGIAFRRRPMQMCFLGLHAELKSFVRAPTFPDWPRQPTRLPVRSTMSPRGSSPESPSVLRCDPDARASAPEHPISENLATTNTAKRLPP